MSVVGEDKIPRRTGDTFRTLGDAVEAITRDQKVIIVASAPKYAEELARRVHNAALALGADIKRLRIDFAHPGNLRAKIDTHGSSGEFFYDGSYYLFKDAQAQAQLALLGGGPTPTSLLVKEKWDV